MHKGASFLRRQASDLRRQTSDFGAVEKVVLGCHVDAVEDYQIRSTVAHELLSCLPQRRRKRCAPNVTRKFPKPEFAPSASDLTAASTLGAAARAASAPPAASWWMGSPASSSALPAFSAVRYRPRQSSSAEPLESRPAPSSSPLAAARSQLPLPTTNSQSAAPTACACPQTCSDRWRATENRPSTQKPPLFRPHFPSRHTGRRDCGKV